MSERFDSSLKTSAAQKPLTGVVSDCDGAKTHMMKDKLRCDCVRYCVKQGKTQYALVVGKHCLPLEGHDAEWTSVRGTESPR